MARRNDLPIWSPASPENSLRAELSTVAKKLDIMTESHHQIFKILWSLGEENRKCMEEAKSRDNSLRRAMVNIQRDLEQLRRLGYKVDKNTARRGEAEMIQQIKAGVDAMNKYLDDEDFRTNLEDYHRQNVERWLAEKRRLDEEGIVQERPSVAASEGHRDEHGDRARHVGRDEDDDARREEGEGRGEEAEEIGGRQQPENPPRPGGRGPGQEEPAGGAPKPSDRERDRAGVAPGERQAQEGSGGVQGEQEVRRPGPQRRTGSVEADVIEVASSEEEEPPRPQKAIRSAGPPGKKKGEWRQQEEGRYPCTAPGCDFKGWAQAYRRHQLRVHGVKWLANGDNRMKFQKHNRWTGPGPDYILRNPSGQVDNLAAALEDAGVSTPEEPQAARDQQLEDLLSHMSSEDDGGSEDENNVSAEEPTERAEPGGEPGGPVTAEDPKSRTEAEPELDKEVAQREPTAAAPEEGEQRPRDKACRAGPEEGGQREPTAVEPEERDKRPQDSSGGARPKEAGRRECVPRPWAQSAEELTAARAAARERHEAEERQFEEMLARLQEEQEQPDGGEPEKKEPNPTKKRRVLTSEGSNRKIVLQHIFGPEDTAGTPERPTRKEPSTTTTGTSKRTPGLPPGESSVSQHILRNEHTAGTPESPTRKEPSTTSSGTPRRTPGLTLGESEVTGGRGGNGHGQVSLSWQETICRAMTVRAVDGTGASTTESTASTPRARTCPECEYYSVRDDNLRRHILTVHPEGDSARRIRELPGRWQAAGTQQRRRDTKSKTPRGTKKSKKEQKTDRKVWVPLPPAPPEN